MVHSQGLLYVRNLTDQGFPIAKAASELGYEPRLDFDEGMHEVEAWLKEREGV